MLWKETMGWRFWLHLQARECRPPRAVMQSALVTSLSLVCWMVFGTYRHSINIPSEYFPNPSFTCPQEDSPKPLEASRDPQVGACSPLFLCLEDLPPCLFLRPESCRPLTPSFSELASTSLSDSPLNYYRWLFHLSLLSYRNYSYLCVRLPFSF